MCVFQTKTKVTFCRVGQTEVITRNWLVKIIGEPEKLWFRRHRPWRFVVFCPPDDPQCGAYTFYCRTHTKRFAYPNDANSHRVSRSRFTYRDRWEKTTQPAIVYSIGSGKLGEGKVGIVNPRQGLNFGGKSKQSQKEWI